MKTKKITLSNDFHKTEITLVAKFIGQVNGENLYQWHLSDRQVKRARRKLCPCSDCTCIRTFIGTRGAQREWVACHQDYSDGSAYLLMEGGDV